MVERKGWSDRASADDAVGHGLSLAEYHHIRELLGRDLSILEIGMCAALYSEHCSYKSTRAHLKNLPTAGPRVIQGPGENAGVVDIGDGQAVVFKVESHNHPSFIEPYQGAATGVGGIVRDIFTMGARPIALMNALRFGAPDNSRTPYLLSRAVAGIAGYGNCIGVPTVRGELFFHEAFNGNCLVNAFCLGLVEKNGIFYARASGTGNAVMYVGSKTGRDGIHGATMSSEAFAEGSEEKRPTVQVGDPFQEKLLIEACLEAMASGVVLGIQDMGAAGLTSSGFEMAERGKCGIRLHLDRVPAREDGMTPYDLMLSESQERMLLVVKRGEESRIQALFDHWGLDAVAIGEVIEGDALELFWHGALISSTPVSVLTSAVPQLRWAESPPADYESKISFPAHTITLAATSAPDLNRAWYTVVTGVNSCSRQPVYQQYDSTIRSNTVVHPGSDAAVLRIKSPQGGREKGIALTIDCNSRYCSIDPRLGTAHSLAEAIRNLAAVGAEPIGISDCLNFGSPERPEGMWQIAEAIRGLADAARAFGVPIVSGNVSLYNETMGRPVLPTPMLAVVGLLEDASRAIGSHFLEDGDTVFVFGETRGEELGGSEYLALLHGIEKGALPRLDYDMELRVCAFIRNLVARRFLRSCHDLSAGGLAVALAESCFGARRQCGVVVEAHDFKGHSAGLLFAESGARFVVSCDQKHAAKIELLAAEQGIPLTLSGRVGGAKIEIKGVAELALPEVYRRWRDGLAPLFS